MFKTSAQIGMVIGAVAVLATMGFGHAQGQRIADTQPMKLAAAEGLWKSEDPAGLLMFQIGNEAERTSVVNIRIPSLLSFLSYNTTDGLVHGINDLQAEYEQQYGPGDDALPAIWLTYWSFRAMVGAGALMFVLAVLGIVFARSNRLSTSKWPLRLLVLALFLPYLANRPGGC